VCVHRDCGRYKEDLGNAVANFARIVPDGLLVFFPSYGVLEMCLKHWRENDRGAECKAHTACCACR